MVEERGPRAIGYLRGKVAVASTGTPRPPGLNGLDIFLTDPNRLAENGVKLYTVDNQPPSCGCVAIGGRVGGGRPPVLASTR